MNENKTTIIYQVKPDESLSDILDFIKESSYDCIFIEVGAGIEFFKNLLNLKLLKKECESLGKEIVFITKNPELEALFRESGFSVEVDRSPEDVQRGGTEDYLEEFRDTSRKIFDIIPPKHEGTFFQRETEVPSEKEDFEEGIVLETSEEIIPEETEIEEELPAKKEELEFLEEKKQPTKRRPVFSFSSFKGLAKIKKPILPILGLEKVLFIFAGIALVVAGIAFYLVLPKAEVLITPRSEKITYELTLTADVDVSEIDPQSYKIPGEIISHQDSISMEFLSSGKEAREEKAKGIITIYNSYSSGSQTLVETTRFISKEGKLFRTAKTIVVPGAEVEDGEIIPSTIDVEVVAAEAGEDYNIGPSTFSIPGFKGTPKYMAFYGKSSSSMSGGFKGETEVITEEDFKKAEAEISEKIIAKLNEELEKKLPKDLVFLEGAKKEEVLEMKSDKNTGDTGKKFNLNAKAQKKIFLFNENDIGILVQELLTSQLGEKKYLLEEGQKFRHKEVVPDFDNGTMKLALEVDEQIIWKIDLDYIKENLAGQKEEEVRRFLGSLEGVADARVTISPFWASRLPKDKEKILVEIEMERVD